MSRDSHGNPSQPHCASVSWLVFVYTCLYVVCVGKIWASFVLVGETNKTANIGFLYASKNSS